MRSTWDAIVLLFTLRCKESTQIVSAGFERELSSVERWAVRLHFVSCRYCYRFQKQLKLIHQAAKQRASISGQLPPAARSHIAAAMESRLRDR